MATILKMKSETKDTVDRQALAAAIADANEATRIANAARDAVARAQDMVDAAGERLSTAIADAANYKSAATARMVSAATSGARIETDNSLRNARAREQDARDDLDAARDALDAVTAALVELDEAERKAHGKVQAAAKTVLREALETTAARVRALDLQTAAAREVLWLLVRNSFEWPPTERSQAFERLLVQPGLRLGPDAASLGPWYAALEALQRDANAPLPEIGG